MMESRGDLDLTQKSVGAQRRGEFGTQNFDRHFAAVLQVFGEVDSGHSTSTEFSLDGVEIGKGGG